MSSSTGSSSRTTATVAGHTDAVADEQQPVAAADVVEVESLRQGDADGAHVSGGCRRAAG